MKKMFFLMATLPLFTSCASMILDTRDLGVFTVIENNTPYDIHYYQGPSHSIKVHACEMDLPFIKTVVINGQLFVSYDSNHHFRNKPYVEVYSPHFKKYNGLGSGDFRAKKPMQTNNVVLNMNGSGHASFRQMTADNIEINNQGSGNVRMKDSRANQKTTVVNQGSGDVKGRVDTQEFKGHTTNTGDINMKGNASTVTTKQDSTGRTEYRRTNGSRAERSNVSNSNHTATKTATNGNQTTTNKQNTTRNKTRGGR